MISATHFQIVQEKNTHTHTNTGIEAETKQLCSGVNNYYIVTSVFTDSTILSTF